MSEVLRGDIFGRREILGDLARSTMEPYLAIERVRALHTPTGVYDECDCPAEQREDGRHIETEWYYTCRPPEYWVCEHCCTDGVDAGERCVEQHDHGPGLPICPTIAALDGVGDE